MYPMLSMVTVGCNNPGSSQDVAKTPTLKNTTTSSIPRPVLKVASLGVASVAKSVASQVAESNETNNLYDAMNSCLR